MTRTRRRSDGIIVILCNISNKTTDDHTACIGLNRRLLFVRGTSNGRPSPTMISSAANATSVKQMVCLFVDDSHADCFSSRPFWLREVTWLRGWDVAGSRRTGISEKPGACDVVYNPRFSKLKLVIKQELALFSAPLSTGSDRDTHTNYR